MMDEKRKLKLKGVSPKMLKRMKLESVDCPVFEKEIGFIQCYVVAIFTAGLVEWFIARVNHCNNKTQKFINRNRLFLPLIEG